MSATVANGDVMVNATEMAKSFGKKPAKWLELPSTISLLDVLRCVRKFHTSMAQTVMGTPTTGGGTWMHEDVALEFARWLNPRFAIWCNDRIKELVKHGVTTMDPEKFISDPAYAKRVLNDPIKAREETQAVRAKVDLKTIELQKAAPKVHYYNEVLQSGSLIFCEKCEKCEGLKTFLFF